MISKPSKEQLDSLSMDWRFVLGQSFLLFAIVSVQNAVVGIIAGLLMFAWWRKKWNYQEALVAIFIITCALASSRSPGLQYLKNLRLLPATFLFIEAIKALQRRSNSFRNTILTWLFLLVTLTTIPALLSDDVGAGLFETVLLLSLWFTMLVMGQIQSSAHVKQRFENMFHMVTIVVGVSILVYFTNGDLAFLNGRFRGVFGNPNEMSHWVFPFVLMIYLSKTLSTQRQKQLSWLVVLGLLALTGTRGAFVALLLGFLGNQVIGASRSIARFFYVFLMVLMVFVSQLLDAATISNLLPERLVRQESLEEGGGRLVAWEYAVQEIKERPLLGGGGGYEERYFRKNYTFFAMKNHQGLSHNSWLAFAMNFGIPAALILILSLAYQIGLFRGQLWLLAAPAFLFSLTVEGWLNAPMSASSPVLFFVGGWLGSKYKLDNKP